MLMWGRVASAPLIFGLGVAGYLQVEPGETLPAVFKSLQMFVLGGDLVFHTELAGRPFWHRLLWVLHFMGPLLLAESFYSFLVRLDPSAGLGPDWRGHILVVGAGNLGLRMCEELLARRQVRDWYRIALVEMDANNPHVGERLA